jgi:hypothetical protein
MTTRGKAHTEALGALRRVLGAPPPPGVAALGARELSWLGAAIEDARRRHSEELTAAIDEALLQVPSLLRGPVRRIVKR